MRVKVVSDLPNVRNDPKGVQSAINSALKTLEEFYITEVRVYHKIGVAYIFYTPLSRKDKTKEE